VIHLNIGSLEDNVIYAIKRCDTIDEIVKINGISRYKFFKLIKDNNVVKMAWDNNCKYYRGYKKKEDTRGGQYLPKKN